MLAFLTTSSYLAWPLLALSTQAPEPLTAASAREAILTRLCEGNPQRLRGVQLAWKTYDRSATPRLTGSFEASLRFPDRLRIEARHPNGTSTVWRLEGSRCWVGPNLGPFLSIEGPARTRVEATFLLLGSLLGWDLLPGAGKQAPKLRDGMLVTRATWRSDEPTELRRRLEGDPPRVRQLEIGARRCRLRGELPGGRLAKEIQLPETRIVMTRFIADCAFKDAFFRPESRPGKVISTSPRNFKRPRLEQVPARFELVTSDPGTWRERMRLQGRLGRALYEAGWFPELASYTLDRKMILPFRKDPTKKGEPEKPREHEVRRLGSRLFCVFHVEKPWAEAVRLLEERLHAHAREIGLRPHGPIYLEPKVEPRKYGPDGPASTKAIVVRGQVELR